MSLLRAKKWRKRGIIGFGLRDSTTDHGNITKMEDVCAAVAREMFTLGSILYGKEDLADGEHAGQITCKQIAFD